MGTTVSRASLANPNLIKNLKLKIGSEVFISKRGDIIPKIESVIKTPPDAKGNSRVLKRPQLRMSRIITLIITVNYLLC